MTLICTTQSRATIMADLVLPMTAKRPKLPDVLLRQTARLPSCVTIVTAGAASSRYCCDLINTASIIGCSLTASNRKIGYPIPYYLLTIGYHVAAMFCFIWISAVCSVSRMAARYQCYYL